MNNNQVKDSASNEKGTNKAVRDKASADESTQDKGKTGKQGDKDGAVLGDINDDAKTIRKQPFGN